MLIPITIRVHNDDMMLVLATIEDALEDGQLEHGRVEADPRVEILTWVEEADADTARALIEAGLSDDHITYDRVRVTPGQEPLTGGWSLHDQ